MPFRSLALNSYIPGILCGPLRDAYIWHGTDKAGEMTKTQGVPDAAAVAENKVS